MKQNMFTFYFALNGEYILRKSSSKHTFMMISYSQNRSMGIAIGSSKMVLSLTTEIIHRADDNFMLGDNNTS